MRLGIGVMSFDRPHYLASALGALAANDLSDCDVWLFQDGATCAFTGAVKGDQPNIDTCVELFRGAALPNARVVLQTRNVGIALNRITLFEVLKGLYDAFVFVEDDAVVAPQFVAVMRKLLVDFAGDTDIGLLCSPATPREGAPNRIVQYGAYTGAMATRREWFEPLWECYQNLAAVWREYPYTPHEAYMDVFEERFGDSALCSSDVALNWAAVQMGRPAWELGAPRARNIGVEGVHCRPEVYHRLRMGEVELRAYEGELTERWVKEIPCTS